MKRLNQKTALAAAMAMVFSAPALATNGMNMEGYGPIATSMGGASMAYDNGTAAVMNNPATLSMMNSEHRFDVAVGVLGPRVDATVDAGAMTMTSDSTGRSYMMPAMGWAKKSGTLIYGVGVFAQGGMGTEFGSNSWMADPSMGTNTALTAGLVNRSEVSVGRAILPLSFSVNDSLSVAATLDYVWAGMDLQMAMSEAQFQDLANPAAQNIGEASGTLVQGFGLMYEPFGGTGVQKLHHAYFDFSNDDKYSGKAQATGYGGKIGLAYKINRKLNVGATYHAKTSLSDMTTSDAVMSMGVLADTGVMSGGAPSGTYVDMNIPVSGKITVKNFQWPATYAFGAAYQASDKLMVVADVKQIAWSDVMKDFSMSFEADNVAANGGFAGAKMDMALYQNWDDQTVISLGGAYQVKNDLVLRAGYNHANNPVPEKYLNALFPAIVESHLTLGLGMGSGAQQVDLSFTKALNVESTNPGNGSTIPAVTSSHSQFSWQLMYSYRY
ncbi:MAG: outer membrane protein transport protein [Gammaproteobacteria bacterium]|nr:outer membrane protein transport protein [Gammaproteobacteria bacterium]